ncbi:MAG: CZB domain-containing protein, partial [Alphaproteobacteria bacterium]
MALQNIVETSKIIDAISGLETASNAHIEWLKNFHRIIVCGLPFDDALADPEAHTRCFFGRWYYGARDIAVDPELFRQIGETHHDFHRMASEVLTNIREGRAVDEGKYDAFMNVVVQFNDH